MPDSSPYPLVDESVAPSITTEQMREVDRLMVDEAEGADPVTELSHWRIHLSPVGPGHVLFLKSHLTDNQVRIYSDNIALVRWLQKDIEGPKRAYAGADIPVVDAEFSNSGGFQWFWTESVESETNLVTMTWYDFDEPFMMVAAPGDSPGRPDGVYSLFIPARRAQVTVNGEASSGTPQPRQIGDRDASNCCLALSETWVIPRDA